MSSYYPSEWRLMPLGEIVTEFISGGTPNTNIPVYWNGSIPWITGADAEQQIATEARKYVTEQGVRESATHIVPKGNILLVTRTGVGKVSVAGVDIAISQDLTGVVPNRDIVNVEYLYRQLEHIIPNLQRMSQGTIILGVQREQVEALPVPLPPLPEQRRIAAILDAADEAIRAGELVIAKLRQVKAGALHDLLTCGVDAQGRLRDPRAHPEQFKDSPLGRIPREWETPTINDLAVHVGSGATPRGGSEVYQIEGVLFIRSQNVDFGELLLDEVAYIDFATHQSMSRSEIFPHDVLLNITGASIGRCCPLPEGLGPANVNQHVCAIRLSEPTREDAVFLSTVLASNIGQHQIYQFNAGSNREGLNYQQLRSFMIPWPARNERDCIAAILDAHDARLRAEEAAVAKLRQVKAGLMEDLLTGKVRSKAL